MNKLKTHMLIRLIIPIVGFIYSFITEDMIILAFFSGYLLCWIFSFLAIHFLGVKRT